MQLTPVAQAVQQLCRDIAYAAWVNQQEALKPKFEYIEPISFPQPQIVLDNAK